MRLQSFLSNSGVASRRKAAELVHDGKVSVNGKVVKEPGYKVQPEKDAIEFEGKRVKFELKLYFAFNKPAGVLSTVTDPGGRRTVVDFFKGAGARVYPVGRLDRDTTGLLLMTNDGDFTQAVMHPRYGCEKIYEALLKRRLLTEETRRAEAGLVIEGRKSAVCRVEFETRTSKNEFLYRITLHEGRKRQIREMMRILGAPLVALSRVQIGNLKLGSLAPGHFRPLEPEEVEGLRGESRRG